MRCENIFYLLLKCSLVILSYNLLTAQPVIYSPFGAVPRYIDNPFPVDWFFLHHFSDLTAWLPIIFLISVIFFVLKSNATLNYFFLSLAIFIMCQRNQLISGADMSIPCWFLLYLFFKGKRRFAKIDDILLSLTIAFLYSTSAVAKLQQVEWSEGQMLSYLLEDRISYWMNFNFGEKLNYFLKLLTWAVLILEGASLIFMFHKKLRKIWNIAFMAMHTGILFTLKIPSLSLMMISIHYLLYNLSDDSKIIQ